MTDFGICENCFFSSKDVLSRFSDVEPQNKSIDKFIEPIRNELKTHPMMAIDDLSKYELFQIAAEKISEFSERYKHEFCIIDFWTPLEREIPLYALYVLFNKRGTQDKEEYYNALGDNYEKLQKLYLEEEVDTLIFDTNKVLTRLEKFQPIILTNKKNQTIIENEELFINFEPIDKLINEYRDENQKSKEFIEYLKNIYNECPNTFPNNTKEKTKDTKNKFFEILLGKIENSVSKKIYDEILNENINESNDADFDENTRGGTKFENRLKAFVTYLFFFREILPTEEYSEYIYFPATAPVLLDNNSNIFHRWIGGILFGFKEDQQTTVDTRINYQNFVQNIISSSYQLYQLFSFKEEETRALKSAKKSAITQVMARNMSHNIGSHVLAKLSTKESLEFSSVKANRSYNIDKLLHNIAKLNEYLKLRMDFLADIATTVPTFEVQKNLRNDVLKWFHSEGGENQYELILNHIAGNEKKVIINLPDTKYFVSFPNDLLGVQAFYVIIENIIRNTAKHSKSSNSSFQINFEIDEDKNPELISVTIFDDCQSLESNTNLANEQNSRINEPLLKNGVLRQNAWGTLEMKIAAAYLRKVPTSDIDQPKYNPIAFKNLEKNEIETKNYIPPLIEALNQYGSLAYRIYLMKPKELLIVDNTSYNNSNSLSQEQIERLRYWGIWYYKKDNLSFDKTFNQKFVLLINPDEDTINEIRSNLKNFPFRKFILNNKIDQNNFNIYSDDNFICKLKSISQKQDVDDLILTFWNLWTSSLCEKQKITSLEFQKWAVNGEGDSFLSFPKELLPKNAKDKKVAVYHHHKCKGFKNNFSDTFYFEQYGSSGLLAPLVDKVEEDDSLIQQQFIESIITRVAIIDERIQEISNQKFNAVNGFNNNSNPSYLKIFEKAKIEILPEETANLNAPEYTNEIKVNVKNWIQGKVGSLDFLVIHLGVLERICGTSSLKDEEKKKKVKSYLDNIQTQNNDLKIVVISGRGRPDTLPEDTLFIHYSLISQYIFENRSKFHLTQLLYSSRKQI